MHFHSVFNAPICVHEEKLWMESPALLKNLRTLSKNWQNCSKNRYLDMTFIRNHQKSEHINFVEVLNIFSPNWMECKKSKLHATSTEHNINNVSKQLWYFYFDSFVGDNFLTWNCWHAYISIYKLCLSVALMNWCDFWQ